jgi:sugar O-acyltransferase (sialic acid O-acetyltransferase NeuD family)
VAEPLIVVGVGGFGRETLDVVEAVNAAGTEPRWDIVGVVDDGPSDINLERLRSRGIRFLGRLDAIPTAAWVVIGVGAPQIRAGIAARLSGRCAGFATIIHPAAVVGTGYRAGEGTVVCAHVSIGTNVWIGRHVHLNSHSVVGHDARLSDYVSVNPNGTISGDCVVESEVLIGAGAVVLQGIRVAAQSLIGAAACVTRDVLSTQVLVGVPARPLRRGETP